MARLMWRNKMAVKQVKKAKAILESVGLLLKGGRSISEDAVVKRAGGLAHEHFIRVDQAISCDCIGDEQ